MIFVFGTIFTSIITAKEQISAGPLTPSNIVGIIFFSSCGAVCILLFRVAQNFQRLMVRWTLTELKLLSIDYRLPPKCWPLRKRLLIITTVYLSLSTLEHLLYQAVEIHKHIYDLDSCKPEESNVVKLFIFTHFKPIMDNLPFGYNNFLGIFLSYLNFSYTFFWNFLDLFIILVSLGIAFLFEKINARLNNYRGLIVNENVWAEIRSHHVQVFELLQFVNKSMGIILSLSCFIDGYFMLLQLLNITA